MFTPVLFFPSPQLTSGTFIPKCLRKKLPPSPLQTQVRRVAGGWRVWPPGWPAHIPPCSLFFLLSAGLCSEACLFRLARCPSPKLLRARSAEKRRPVPTFQKVPLPSGPAPAHSLGDLKGSWPGRGLVTRFLQLSRKSPDPAGTAAHGHKQVCVRGARRHPCALGGPGPMPSSVSPSRCAGTRGDGRVGRASTYAAVEI